MDRTITCRFRFRSRVGVLSADSSQSTTPSRWFPQPLPPAGSARRTTTLPSPADADRPTVSIIRGGRGR